MNHRRPAMHPQRRLLLRAGTLAPLWALAPLGMLPDARAQAAGTAAIVSGFPAGGMGDAV